MSFLSSGGLAPAQVGSAIPVNGAARGLGGALGVDPSRISEIAGGIGRVSNGIAEAGGAGPGYQAPMAPQMPNNFMQMMDPGFLQQIMAQFGGRPQPKQFQGYAR